MCGIAGVASRSGLAAHGITQNMIEALHHRGPDGSGQWQSSDGRVAFGHTRLSILDIAGGAQPMCSQCGEHVIVFNGEIYNHQDLREELSKRGASFRTRSDTEVILEAYRAWGSDCVKHLSGMFAFAIYDQAASSLLFARDRSGEKPFYFQYRDGVISFASELKALLCLPNISKKLDRFSLEYFLAYGSVCGSGSIISGIEKLAPGHVMTVNLADGNRDVRRYWSPPVFEPGKLTDESELIDRLEALLEQSVTEQLVADVPVGIMLSGGLDSSLITAMAARASTRPVDTYTVSFPEAPGFDEGPDAARVASHFGTNHHHIDVGRFDINLLNTLARQFDEPIGDQAILPLALMCAEVSKYGKVALTGDGGDELFGGYRHYLWIKKLALYHRLLPNSVGNVLSKIGRRFLPLGMRGRNYVLALGGAPRDAIAAANIFFDYESRKRLLLDGGKLAPLHDSPESYKLSFGSENATLLQHATLIDFHTTLPDMFLVKSDRSSMLESLELRCPWLDHKLIEFAFRSVPDHMKVRGSKQKYLVRALAKKVLPNDLHSRKKRGFNVPASTWFSRQSQEFYRDLVMSLAGGLLDKRELELLFIQQQRGHNNRQRIFGLAMLALWAQHYGITLAVDE